MVFRPIKRKQRWGFAMNKEMADATGIDYSSIKTEEELEPLLEKVKKCIQMYIPLFLMWVP